MCRFRIDFLVQYLLIQSTRILQLPGYNISILYNIYLIFISTLFGITMASSDNSRSLASRIFKNEIFI
jgi:hypothetical protein